MAPLTGAKNCFTCDRGRREATIEADHQQRPRFGGRRQCRLNFVQFLDRQGERLLDEDVFARRSPLMTWAAC